ncbi:unnamed protein product [Cyclocybe aegerita]|uniref:Uncharacterized protein n=1 Tax=Cyclocybe aegerita TaxID=1973307 RepID=A0A8S0WMF9_CYCAE|nr:unnamed protein product [Cyclocybe aegerita]
MSFQHFRLGELAIHQPLQQQPVVQPQVGTSISSTKAPYGSGDSDDGYTLVFANLDEFQAWRNTEEERNCVEFVKGDTHGSKADPPRFKDHTKLVCARHSRSGRKKYVKKHPERVRKVPSRKLEGTGCSASISYKTYFDSEQVRACYISQHSHEIGPANLPFTRRGRKAALQHEKERGRNKTAPPEQPAAGPSTQAAAHAPPVASSSFSSAVSMLAPLPGQTFTPAAPVQPYTGFPAGINYQPQQTHPQERWDNMVTLFQTVRDHARAFEYPPASVAALETVLIRLYLESPMGLTPQQNMGAIVQGTLALAARNQAQANASQPNMNGNDAASSSNAEDTS